MVRIVNVHYIQKAAFMNAEIVENEEEVFAFVKNPSYEEVVEQIKIVLNRMNPSDQVELLRRFGVGLGINI